MSRSEGRSDTVVVLTALPVEAKAVLAHLNGLHSREHPAGTRFKVGVLPGTSWQVAVMGEGGAGAGTMTERAATLFQPAAVFSISVAGALKDDVAFGDVVAATRVYSYQGGKAAEEFSTRPRGWEADHDLLQIAIDVEDAGTWNKRLSHNSRRPTTHFKPIAAGKVVLDARDAPLYGLFEVSRDGVTT